MKEPTLPLDEAQRQADMEALNLLDTGPDPRFDALLRLAQGVFGIRTVLVTLVDNERQWFKARRGTALSGSPRSLSFCGHAIHSDAIMEVPDALKDERFADNPLVTGQPHIRFYAGIALHAPGGSRVGTFCVLDDRPNALSVSQRQSMQDFALVLEAMFETSLLRVEQKQLLVELDGAKRRALLDPLTQLLNREGLEQMLPALESRAQRDALYVGFIYGDLDHFKQINDEHGHGVGDEVLVEVGQRLVAAIRPEDLAVRMGGEEFAVLALVKSHEQLDIVAERVRATMACPPFPVAELMLDVTISLGTAMAGSLEAMDALLLIDRADKALYQAKQAGRNRVVRG
ncbi:GGDEF domain-containing protein [Halopseudomonas salina]|uniref:GGDEF domain-containing protein n=1 Tax=Halopseudomonas salina TaxID=1323744 RepID=A0ABQ1PNL0_9GAMM|nr:sensor domain-containing diguanylate cyclase [Halopseudomonas salina]GGD00167.1 GGDEF domain-containing protein [Halopseudomonas salina]